MFFIAPISIEFHNRYDKAKFFIKIHSYFILLKRLICLETGIFPFFFKSKIETIRLKITADIK
jgi:hypothetical protein